MLRFMRKQRDVSFSRSTPVSGVDQSLRTGPLSGSEIEYARVVLRVCQMSYGAREYSALMGGTDVDPDSVIWNARPFLDRATGLIFCRPRSGQPPIPWLPTPSPLSDLIIREIHQDLFHMGVPSTVNELLRSYWIPRCRRAVRTVLVRCVSCNRQQSTSEELDCLSSEEGALPKFRVEPSRPFENTGLDHFGPLLLRDGSKIWVLLFTCAVTRAIHLEIVQSLDVKETSLAIRRFFAKFGKAKFFISDNGPSFVTLAKCLRVVLSWNLIPPAAPWWGGFWERMVGTVKRSFRKTLGNSSLSSSELHTVLCELEDRINR